MPSETNIESALKRLKRAEGITKRIWPSGFSENSSAGTLTREIHAAIADLTPKRYKVEWNAVHTGWKILDFAPRGKRNIWVGDIDSANLICDLLNAAEDKT